MLGRVYTIVFIITILGALWYQRAYLNNSMVEFNAQLMAENVVLPTMSGKNYRSLSFSNGGLTSSFSGKNFVYYSNKHFEATDTVVYQQFPQTVAGSSQSNAGDAILLETDKAVGEVISAQPENSQTFSSKSKLKNLVLPHVVNFNINNNVGKTSDVFVDALLKTLQTNDPIESKGPDGHVKGVGFFYAVDEGEFKIKSDVEGDLLPSRFPKEE